MGINKDLKLAHEIRKFEIDLYWRRTTYCWTLIAAAFVAFFAVQSIEDSTGPDKTVLSFVIANLGFVFSIGWYFINRGSKFWQQNWETHVDVLEQCSQKTFYRRVFSRPNKNCGLSWILDPDSYSVSKINQITSVYVTLIWIGLIAWSVVQWCTLDTCLTHLPIIRGFLVLLSLFTIVVCILFRFETKTKWKDKGEPYEYSTKTRYATPAPKSVK